MHYDLVPTVFEKLMKNGRKEIRAKTFLENIRISISVQKKKNGRSSLRDYEICYTTAKKNVKQRTLI